MKLDRLLATTDWTLEALADAVRAHLPRGSRTTAATLARLLRTETGTGPRRQTRTASLALALAIERATGGAVRAEDVPMAAASRGLLRNVRRAADSFDAADGRESQP